MQRIFCALALVLVAGAAHATPPGVTDLEGTWFDAEEQPLFTYVLDTQPGQSACDADCLRVWTPLAAQPDAVASGDWSIVQQADGRTLWAHDGRVVYRLIDPDRNGYEGQSALWTRTYAAPWFPPGVTVNSEGLLEGSDGGKLRTLRHQTCDDYCKSWWRPLAPAPDATSRSDWFVIDTSEGRAWQYGVNGLVIYEARAGAGPEPVVQPKPGAIPTSSMVGIRAMRVSKPVTPAPLKPGAPDVHDITVTRAPKMAPDYVVPQYPAASLRRKETGLVSVQLCVGPTGAVTSHTLIGPSGYRLLDDATNAWVPQLAFTPGEVDGQAAETCGFRLEFEWRIGGH